MSEINIGDNVMILNKYNHKSEQEGIPPHLLKHGWIPDNEQKGRVVAIYEKYFIVNYSNNNQGNANELKTMQLGFLKEDLKLLCNKLSKLKKKLIG